MNQITEKLNEINELIEKETKNYNKSHQDISQIIDEKIHLKSYLKKLNRVKGEPDALKYGDKYQTIVTLVKISSVIVNIIIILLISTLLPVSVAIKIVLSLISIIAKSDITAACLKKIDDKLETYYFLFKDKKVTLGFIEKQIMLVEERCNELEKEIGYQLQLTYDFNKKTKKLQDIKTELEMTEKDITQENIIQESITQEYSNENTIGNNIEKDSKKLVKKYPQN